jgi:hypothetical protein
VVTAAVVEEGGGVLVVIALVEPQPAASRTVVKAIMARIYNFLTIWHQLLD